MSVPASRVVLPASLRSLRHRDFRLFSTGQLISLVGTWMQSVAQGWLMHRLTSSPLMLGLLGFCQFLPVTLLSLWAGVVADRMDKRRLIIVTQTCALLQAVMLAAVVTAGVVQPWMVLALAFVFGIFNAFDLPARQSFLVEMVGKEDLSNAIALNSAAFNTARVVGPAVAGVLVATIGEGGCFWINAASYLAVLASLFMMSPTSHAGHTRGASATLITGVRYAWSVRSIRNLLLLLGVCAGIGFQYMVLLPVYARDIFSAGPQGYGLMVTAFGLGSLLAAGWMTRRLDRWDLRRNLLVGLIAGGIGMLGFAWARTMPLALAMGLLAGLGLILYVASTNTLLQMTTEDGFRGRIMSLYTFFFVGTAPFGALLAGGIAQRWGAPVATSVCALVLLAGALWVSVRLREIKAREAADAAARVQGLTQPGATEKLG
jgi:MFS family permease